MKQELTTKINQLDSELKKAKQKLNKFNSMDNNAIELYTDGKSACLKIYLNDMELSIVFKKHPIESEYNGKHQFIPDETDIFNFESNRITSTGGLLEFNQIQIDNTDDLLNVLNRIGNKL